jgi:DNA repair protein RecO (recombination protein O)
MRSELEAAPAIVLAVRPQGESGALVSLLTEAGRILGLAPGGFSRAQAPLWQPGNLIEASWAARPEGLVTQLKAEMVHAAAARAMEDPLALDLLRAACAVAEGALPEREAHPRAFHGLVALIARLAAGGEAAMASFIRWEAVLLAELGYGLDLSRCAATGREDALIFVSPKSGRAVSAEAGAPYADRLLSLPPLLLDEQQAGEAAGWLDGLRLTGFFLARDAFGTRHRPLPPAREQLEARVANWQRRDPAAT